PATGWQYMWNPSWARGRASAYKPLLWSDQTQVYNTTGGATTVPSNKNHDDDYLSLFSGGGHPGRGDVTPSVGYTIQEDDGEGYYRLAGTSIQKWDSTISPQEDGLNLLVYINDTMARSPGGISVDGSTLTFDQDLGLLNVGDTIWLMVDSLSNNYY